MSDNKIKIILFILFIYQFLNFFEVLKYAEEANLYDIIIYQFNYLSLFFIQSIGFLLIIYNICTNSLYNQSLMLKFKSKTQYYTMNIIIVLILAFLYVSFFNILSLIEGIGTLSLDNVWSNFFLMKNTGSINVFFNSNNIDLFLNNINPLQYMIFLNILVFLYFSTIGLLFLAINSLLNKKPLTLTIVIGFICLNMASDAIPSTSNFTFTGNIFILTSSNNSFSNFHFMYYRLFYWIILILILYIIGLVSTKKTDYKCGD